MAEDGAHRGTAVKAPVRQLAHRRVEEEAKSEAAARPAGGAVARLSASGSSKQSRGTRDSFVTKAQRGENEFCLVLDHSGEG
jgi:hypothetical protein